MYIYNITTNINNDFAEKWLTWMEETFIPAMLANKKLKKALICEVLIDEEMGGTTFSTQYFCENKEKLNDFLKNDFEKILNSHSKFNSHKVDFSTELKVLKKL